MFRFPYYNYPYNPYYKYYNKYSHTPHVQSETKENSITNSNEFSNTITRKSSSNSEQAIFEILGIKLFLDDLIILGILFFLYEQNVNDEMLYIILFLLLFS
ncbi:MAG: hypothetical protein IJE05_01525 [Clostridia bacterium]|nr:hypothetical protein [Clostridia bacterium]